MPIKVPNYNSFCITHFETEKVYKCVESDQIVSPLVFHRDFQPPIESVRPEYQVLEEFLDNGNPIPNPYEEFLMNQIEVQEEKPQKVYPYYPNSKEINTHEMSEWSVLNTKMHYVQHPRQAENSLVYSKCEDKIEQGILNKVEKPELVDMSVGDSSVREMFCDQFEGVQNFLRLSDTFNDARDVSTTYLGTDQVMLKDHFMPECSFPIYSNSHTWGQLMGGQPFDMLLDTGASKCYMFTDSTRKTPNYMLYLSTRQQ